MKNKIKKIILVVLFMSIVSPLAQSQIHQGHYEIRQNGVKVGEIFVPARGDGQARYGEVWVVGTNYVYPSESNNTGFEIKPTGKKFKTESDFLSAAKALGGKIIRVEATETPNR
jgi:hypothetical protein